MNIASLLAHKDEIDELLARKRPFILALSETCVTEDIQDSELECDGYKLFRINSHSRMTGGCCIYIKEQFKSELKGKYVLEKNAWIISLKVYCNNKSCVIHVLYHSPSAKRKDFLEFFNDWCENQIEVSENNIICGDFNIDLLSDSHYSTKLKQILNLFALKQYVRQPTRITEISSTLIDLVVSNCEVEVEVLLTEKISDHSTMIIRPVMFKNIRINDTMTKKIIKYDKVAFQNNLKKYDWSDFSNLSVNEKANKLVNILRNEMNKFVNIVKVNVNSDKKWFSKELYELMKKRDDNYKKAVLTSDRSDWKRYKKK